MYNSFSGAPGQNSHCNVHNHRPYITGHATAPPPFSVDMDVVNILLCLRVSNSYPLLHQQSSLRVVLSAWGPSKRRFPLQVANRSSLQVHTKQLASSDMGPCPACTREHILRGQFEQHPLGAHQYIFKYNGLATLRFNTFRSTSRLFSNHIRLCGSGNDANVREKLWLDESNRRRDTINLSMFPAVV